MKFTELIKFSCGNLWRRKSRTILTVLGVMIGAASIIVMMSIGIGLNKSFIDQMENSGSLTLITVYNDSYYGKQDSDTDTVKLDDDAVESFAAIDHVVCSSPLYSFSVMAKTGKYESYLNINAVSYDMLLAMKLPVIEGALPERGDEIKIIAGKQIPYNFYDPTANDWYGYYDENGEMLPPNVDLMKTSVFVIYDINKYYQAQGGEGEMPKKYLLETSAIIGNNSSEGYSQFDYSCYADLDAVKTLFGKIFKNAAWPDQQTDSNGKPIKPMTYQQAYVYVDNIDNVTEVQKQITSLGYQAYSEIDYLNSMKQQSRTIQYVLGGIGSVSLIVAAIGITNTMLMSIYERTKEIGIFKVLGCSMSNIRSMFLYEAGIIGFVGGVFGLALSYSMSGIINLIAHQELSSIPIWLALIGVGFSIVVGMVAGLTPAMRAMKLSPLEAIRSL